jgi:hypothetical protein
MHAVSMEWIMSVMCTTGEILLGWHSMGESSGYSLCFSGNLLKKYFIPHHIICCVSMQGSYVLKGNLLHKHL